MIISAAIEAEIATMAADDRAEFLADLGLDETGLARIIRAGYDLLHLITFFTAGPKEARAWTVEKGAKAPEAAGVIHTDFERGFIRAETIAYDDFVACNGEAGARDKGKLRSEGKDYVVRTATCCCSASTSEACPRARARSGRRDRCRLRDAAPFGALSRDAGAEAAIGKDMASPIMPYAAASC